MPGVRLGKYRHYKGRLYEVIGEGLHTETNEDVVVYRALYDTGPGKNFLFVRPKEIFVATVQVDGRTVSRFEYLG